MSSGNEGCNCIDQTSVLASLENRDCTTATGKPGVYLQLGGSCVSYDYGSNACLQHDLLHDPICQGDLSTTTVPPYCFQSWCYVDVTSCKKNSEEKIYRSEYFPDNQDIFASYSTCNSTNSFSLGADTRVAGGIDITAVVPDYQYPTLNKQLPGGKPVYEQTDVYTYYFDDNIPFGGIYIDYVNSIVALSNGDIQTVNFTHTSKASLKQYTGSSYTAAVQDVENGLVDMAVGPFWITGQRLKMTTYTVPLVYDKTVLVIPKPERARRALVYEVEKVMEPFTYGFWVVAAAVVVVASLLSVWFSDREMVAKKRYGVHLSQSRKGEKMSKKRRATYFRLVLDAILEKGMFFFSAGIEQDMGASLPHKVLMFGFGFFILIAVSAYVANLAAFLTQSGLKMTVGSMKDVIGGNVPICGHPALKEEIEIKWPNANWLWPDGREFHGLLDAYARGEYKVLAIGREDTVMDINFTSRVCELGLVYTDVLITENPIAFPVRPQLASAFSYWMYLGEKSYGIDLKSKKQSFLEDNEIKAKCEFELSNLNLEEVDDFARVSTSNMFLPIMTFVICACIAVVLQVIHERRRKKGHVSTLGRKSSLDIFASLEKERGNFKFDDSDDELVMPRAQQEMQRQQTDNSVVDGAGDEFHDEGALQPQSTPGPTRVSFVDVDKGNEDPDTAVKEEDNDVSHRIEELVESGVIEEVLDCFDFFQEMKKPKKDQ